MNIFLVYVTCILICFIKYKVKEEIGRRGNGKENVCDHEDNRTIILKKSGGTGSERIRGGMRLVLSPRVGFHLT